MQGPEIRILETWTVSPFLLKFQELQMGMPLLNTSKNNGANQVP